MNLRTREARTRLRLAMASSGLRRRLRSLAPVPVPQIAPAPAPVPVPQIAPAAALVPEPTPSPVGAPRGHRRVGSQQTYGDENVGGRRLRLGRKHEAAAAARAQGGAVTYLWNSEWRSVWHGPITQARRLRALSVLDDTDRRGTLPIIPLMKTKESDREKIRLGSPPGGSRRGRDCLRD